LPHSRAGALVASALAFLLLAACTGGAPRTASLAAVPRTVKLPPGPEVYGAWRDTGTPSVALTFDDGPDPVYTPKMLDVLHRHGVKATFCVVGSRVGKYAKLVKRIVAEGHTLCNHSWRHRRDLGKQADAMIVADLTKTNQAILRAAPGAKVRYFRAPYGAFSQLLVDVAERMGMTSIYWSVDTKDWDAGRYGRGPGMVRHIVNAVRHYTRPGSIILAHDLRKPDTVAAIDQILPWLKAQFTLAPLPVPDASVASASAPAPAAATTKIGTTSRQ
jgi:peptidoglycan-N-acetylglucosamine deacetylase